MTRPISVLIILFVVAVVLSYGSYKLLYKFVENNLHQQTKQMAYTVEKEVNKVFEILDTIAISEGTYSTEDSFITKSKRLIGHKVANGLRAIRIADLQGNVYVNEDKKINIFGRTYFKEVIEGEKVVASHIINQIDGLPCTVFAEPIIFEGKIEGVIYGVFEDNYLEKILAESSRDKGRSIFLVKDKDVISYSINEYNDESLIELVELMNSIISQDKAGSRYETFKGNRYLLSYESIDSLEWHVLEVVPSYMFTDINTILGIIILIISIIYMILCNKYLKEQKIRTEELAQIESSQNLMVIRLGRKGNILYCNKYARSQLGYTKEEIKTKSIFDIVMTNDYGKIEKILKHGEGQLKVTTIDLNFSTRAYKKVYAICTAKQLVVNEIESEKLEVEISAVDISQFDLSESDKGQINNLYEEIARSEEELQKRYEELCEKKEALQISEERYRMVVDTASIGIWDWDIKENRLYCSPKITEIFECTPIQIRHVSELEYIHPDDREAIEKITYLCQQGILDSGDCECRILNKEKKYIWVYIIAKVLRDQEGNMIRLTGSLTDINQKKLDEEQMKYIAYYDELTGLTNRNYLKEQFNKQKGHYEPIACIYLDVDNFKFVNDSFGHEYGERVLVEIGRRLSSIANDEIIVSRIAADEFGILLMGIHTKEDIKNFIKKIEKDFNQTFTINTIRFGISFSMGVAIYPNNGDNFDELLNNAGTAMHKAKDKGKRTCIFFDSTFKKLTLEKIHMESDLRQAIFNNEFVLYYQPQMEIASGKLKGFEALIRWIKEDGTMVPPIKFIDVAEETGLMIPIGAWVIREACEFINRLQKEGYGDLYVAVNISVVQLIQDNFVDVVEEILKETKVDATKLHIEITETMLMESIEANIEKIERIQQKGVIISLDDFGKGYSSLTYLKQLPINVLKIEKAFVDDIIEDHSKNITGAIINLGHELSLEVVAEGVEEDSQLEYLKAYNCDMIQGYLFSKPIPEDEAIKFIQKGLDK